MVKIKISKHALERIKERLGLSDYEIKDIVLNAWERGKTVGKFKGDIKEYILKKMGSITNGKYRTVVYNDIVFIFSAQHPTLVTTYELPEELKSGK